MHEDGLATFLSLSKKLKLKSAPDSGSLKLGCC